MSPITRIGRVRPERCIFFMCDIQEKFANVIKGFPSVEAVASRMESELRRLQLDASALLGIPVIATEQYPQGLGRTIPSLSHSMTRTFEKTLFSMLIPDVELLLREHPQRQSVCLFGLELDGGHIELGLLSQAHVCVQQTALDLLDRGYEVHILADGVSSRTSQDRLVAFERMRQAGAFITTSESVLFELLAGFALLCSTSCDLASSSSDVEMIYTHVRDNLSICEHVIAGFYCQRVMYGDHR